MSAFAEYMPDLAVMRENILNDIVTRKARLRDVPHLATILQERSGGDYVHYLDCFKREVALGTDLHHKLLLVAEYQNRVIGYGRVIFFEPPADAPAHTAPCGWYLGGIVVASDMRRQGVAFQLTDERLSWVAEQSTEVHYISNINNLVSIDLHRKFGFVEISRNFHFPGMQFAGGIGALFRMDLTEKAMSLY